MIWLTDPHACVQPRRRQRLPLGRSNPTKVVTWRTHAKEIVEWKQTSYFAHAWLLLVFFLNCKEEAKKMAFSKHRSEAASCLVKENPMTSSVCCVCLSDMKDPRLLACLHSCCRSCLDKMSVTAGQRKIACPVCRASCTLPPSGAGGLPKDFTRVSERSSAVEKKCWEEDCDAKAALWCKECERAFCKQHGAMHLVSSPGDHYLGPVPSGITNSGGLSRSAALCHDHGEPLVFFCVNCNEIICAHCAAIGKHRRHDVVSIKEVTIRKKEEAMEMVDQIRKDIVPNVGASLEAVRDRTAELTRQANEVRGEIRRAEERAVGMVRAYAEQLVEEVDAVEEARCKDLDKQKDTLESHLQALQNAVQFCDHLMEKEEASGDDFADLLDALVTRSKDLSKIDFEKTPVRHARLGFKAVSDKELLATLAYAVGVVMSHDAVASKCTVETFSPTIRPGEPVEVAIQTRDIDGGKLTEGGQLINAFWSKVPDQSTCLSVKDLKDSRYLVCFTPHQPGKYHLQITVNSENMPKPIVMTCFDHCFDPSECHGNISLSADLLQATRLTDGFSRTKHQYRECVLGVVGMRTGRHSWKVQVGEDPNWSFVGIIPKPLPPTTFFYRAAFGWNDCGNCHKLADQWSGINKSFASLRGNDIVQLDMDCDQHTLQITVLRTGERDTITGLTPNTEYFQFFSMEVGQRGMTMKLVWLSSALPRTTDNCNKKYQ